ncbi:MAG: hypothetical protein LM589_01510 [Thermosphaera sp.]|nr:hypothetical protein [Thermosphaera sp.]
MYYIIREIKELWHKRSHDPENTRNPKALSFEIREAEYFYSTFLEKPLFRINMHSI